MSIHEIRVGQKERDTKGEGVFHEAQRTVGASGLEKVVTTRVYRLEGTDEAGAEKLAKKLFAEQIDQVHTINKPLITDAQNVIEVAYKPGVMNPA